MKIKGLETLLPKREYFYKDPKGKTKRYVYCCMCPAGPFKESQVGKDYISTGNASSLCYCIKCWKTLGLTSEDDMEKQIAKQIAESEKRNKRKKDIFDEDDTKQIDNKKPFRNTFKDFSELERASQKGIFGKAPEKPVEKIKENSTQEEPVKESIKVFGPEEPDKEIVPQEPVEKMEEDTPVEPIKEEIGEKTAPEEPLEEIKEEVTPEEHVEKIKEEVTPEEPVEEIKEEVTPVEPLEEIKEEITPEEPLEEIKEEVTPEEHVEEIKEEVTPVEPIKEEIGEKTAPEEPVEGIKEEVTPEEPVEEEATEGLITDILVKKVFEDESKVILDDSEIGEPVFKDLEIECDEDLFYVYIAQQSNGSYRIEVTNNVEEEISNLNSGKNPEVTDLPVELVYCREKENLEDALLDRYHIANMNLKQKEILIDTFLTNIFKEKFLER